MKTFLYLISSLRDGQKDSEIVVGGTHYHHEQLLVVIEAENAEHAARALNIQILTSMDRSSVGLPTIYYTSDYYGGPDKHPLNHGEGYFFLALKEIEKSDSDTHPDLEEKMRLKVVAPAHFLK